METILSKRKRLGITAKTSLVTGLVVLALLTVASGVILRFQSELVSFIISEHIQKVKQTLERQSENEKAAFREGMEISLETAASLSAIFLYEFDEKGLRLALAPYLKQAAVHKIEVFDHKKNLFVAMENGDAGSDALETLATETVYRGEVLGAIRFHYSDALFTARLRAMEQRAEAETEGFRDTVNRRIERAFRGQVATVALILLLVIASIWGSLRRTAIMPIRCVARKLFDKAAHFARASEQISKSSKELARGVSEQAATLQQISASLEEISEQTRANADHSTNVTGLIRDVNQEARTVKAEMEGLIRSVEEIENASRSTSRIVRTVEDIAFQTNLLALNAAVESARAGEAGQGFAVVAGEVRNLATRSSEAATKTAELIENTIRMTERCVEITEKTAIAFENLLNNSDEVGRLVAQISDASGNQATHINQINQAVSETDRVIQMTAANTEESSNASEEMFAHAQEMKSVVRQLNDILTGARAAKDGERTTRMERELTLVRYAQ